MSNPLQVTPEVVAGVIVHFASKLIEPEKAALEKHVKTPEGWRTVHEEFLLLLYCLTISRILRGVPIVTADKFADAVLRAIAATKPPQQPVLGRLMSLLAPARGTVDLPTACFADPRRIRIAVSDYLADVEARFEEARKAHRGIPKEEPWAYPVFQGRLMDCLGLPEFEPEVLYASLRLRAGLAGLLKGTDEWQLIFD